MVASNRSPMENRPDNRQAVAHHYNTHYAAEAIRLSKSFPIEFGITKRCLERWILEFSKVIDVGVGGGHYAEILARRNCILDLVDISSKLLESAIDLLQSNGFTSQIRKIEKASATDLSFLESGTYDAVLLLGPLYHLQALEERQRAVSEAARILKPGGILFAGGINRFSYLRELFREYPQRVLEYQAFHQQYLKTGNLDASHAPPLGVSHLTTIAEFRQLFASSFSEISLLGVESFAGAFQSSLIELPPAKAEAWLDLVEQTAMTPEGLGATDHFLFIGNKM
jgi:2-polyprenyl-3-methyl-5-hydroxy-6-metoxy-1,4-benzoquinol methylase